MLVLQLPTTISYQMDFSTSQPLSQDTLAVIFFFSFFFFRRQGPYHKGRDYEKSPHQEISPRDLRFF